MNPETWLLIISFFLLLSLGVPIAYSIGISSLLTLLITIDSIAAFTTIAQRMATGLDSFTLLAIPFFILAGQLMNQGGIATRLIDFAKVLVGRLPGGLAYVNVIACMLFGAIAGSAVAAASAIGSFMVPNMVKEGYSKPYSAAVNITSATNGLIIPPSNILIVYSLASGGASIGALFLAGYFPGILLGAGLMIVAGVIAYRNKYRSTAEKINLSIAIKKFLDAIPSLLLLFIVIGGIVAGIFTATEASAIAVVYTFILTMIYKEIQIKDLKEILLKAGITTSIVLFLVATSMALSWVMSFENIPQNVSAALLSLSENKIVVLILINLILLIVGAFVDITPAVLIFTPIFLPVVTSMGMDPVHFGIVMVMNLCIGLCTPPVGTVLFVGCGVANVPIHKVLKPLMPLFLIMVVVLFIITFIPEISLWLPEVFGL